MYRIVLLYGNAAKHFMGAKPGEVALCVTELAENITHLRTYATHFDALNSPAVNVVVGTLVHSYYGVQCSCDIPGKLPSDYDELCVRLGVVSEDRDEAETAAMDAAAATAESMPIGLPLQHDAELANYAAQRRPAPVQPESRPEHGRATAPQFCGDCGNNPCTCVKDSTTRAMGGVLKYPLSF